MIVLLRGSSKAGRLAAEAIAEAGESELPALMHELVTTLLLAPEMITRIVEIPFVGGPFGAKGVGEIPMDGPAPAVAQAIEAATGVVLDNLPMTPERIIDAMDGA